MVPRSRTSVCATAAALLLQPFWTAVAQEAPQQPTQAPGRIRVTSELVLVNVVVRDKNGDLVRGLKKEDFTVYEDGKQQEIRSFDFENVDELALAGKSEATVTGSAAEGGLLRAGPTQAAPLDARDRRLMLLFFDFTGMDPEQIERSVNAANKFVESHLQPADLVALVSPATSLRVDLDFTGDKTKILSALSAYTSGQGQGFESDGTGSAEGGAETSGSFAVDDTDYNQFDSNAATQETLSTLAADTGGKAFFDSNDFGAVFSQVQKDSSAYYVLGFTSSNKARDGRFRRLRVQVKRPNVKLDHRSGYYADRDFEHMNRAGREQQLEDELTSDLPQTDVIVYAGAAHFRQDDAHYYLAVSLVIPGSQIPFVSEKDKDNATIDIIGEVREGGKMPVGHLRDTVKLAEDQGRQVRSKNVQYNTGFVLPPGSFHLKFIVRENQTGRIGSFETDVQIPDLRKAPMRLSSVVLANP